MLLHLLFVCVFAFPFHSVCVCVCNLDMSIAMTLYEGEEKNKELRENRKTYLKYKLNAIKI